MDQLLSNAVKYSDRGAVEVEVSIDDDFAIELCAVIRGELLRRYPNTVIYAVRAVGPAGARTLSKLAADEVHPIFRGTLEPDVTFLGFNLTPAEVVAGSPNDLAKRMKAGYAKWAALFPNQVRQSAKGVE